jgi:hypothetical protein
MNKGMVLFLVVQMSITDDDDGKMSGKGAVAAGGFTILSEKKLFLGQKVCSDTRKQTKITRLANVHLLLNHFLLLPFSTCIRKAKYSTQE